MRGETVGGSYFPLFDSQRLLCFCVFPLFHSIVPFFRYFSFNWFGIFKTEKKTVLCYISGVFFFFFFFSCFFFLFFFFCFFFWRLIRFCFPFLFFFFFFFFCSLLLLTLIWFVFVLVIRDGFHRIPIINLDKDTFRYR